jgi:hypothetical protein
MAVSSIKTAVAFDFLSSRKFALRSNSSIGEGSARSTACVKQIAVLLTHGNE